MNLRSRIIPLVLLLQYPPFIWFFRAYYWLAIQASRLSIGRIEGVRSIYLSGSLVRQEMIYGLSDIDFKIFVAGGRNQEIYGTIRRRFSLLARVFPMLGSPDEKGIYFLQSFPADYRHHPLVQHLFDDRFFKHRLLSGEDLWAELPLKSNSELDQTECAFGRLKDWMERIHLLADAAELCRPQKQHLFFKAVSDVALLAIRIDAPQFTFRRRVEILREISSQLDERNGHLIENLIRENLSCYRIQCNGVDENLQLFKKMVAICAKRASSHDGSEGISSLDIEVRLPHCEDEKPAVASLLRSFSPKIRNISLFRWPQLPLNPFDLHLFDVPVYLLECSEPLGTEELHRLKVYYRRELRKEAVVLLREHPEFLSSVDADLVDHWGSFPGSSDLLYFLLGAPGRRALTEKERIRVETRIRAFQEQLAAALSHPEFGRMDLCVFPRFLFNAMRVLIFSAELRQHKWQQLFTPGQIVDFLEKETPLLPAFLRRLAEEYEKVMSGTGGFDERLLPKCRFLLAEMLEIAQRGSSWEPLEELNELPDEHHLKISAAIITADRPLQLERCMKSLTQLARPPEELIVVENGKEPQARRTVENIQACFPIHYLSIDQRGVAVARNAAARAARGEIIAFVDDDATVAPDWLERLERVFLRDPRVGLAAGATLNMDCGRKDRIWNFMQSVEKV